MSSGTKSRLRNTYGQQREVAVDEKKPRSSRVPSSPYEVLLVIECYEVVVINDHYQSNSFVSDVLHNTGETLTYTDYSQVILYSAVQFMNIAMQK